MFPRRNKAHRYALPSRGHQWWWWWCWWWCRTRGEEDVAWPGSKWKLLKPLSPRANERSLSRLPGWDPGRKCQRSTAPNRSIYTKNLPSSRYFAPTPINRARVSLDGSLSRVILIYCLLVSFLSCFSFIYFFSFFVFSLLFLYFTIYFTKHDLSHFPEKRIVSSRHRKLFFFFLIGIWAFEYFDINRY